MADGVPASLYLVMSWKPRRDASWYRTRGSCDFSGKGFSAGLCGPCSAWGGPELIMCDGFGADPEFRRAEVLQVLADARLVPRVTRWSGGGKAHPPSGGFGSSADDAGLDSGPFFGGGAWLGVLCCWRRHGPRVR